MNRNRWFALAVLVAVSAFSWLGQTVLFSDPTDAADWKLAAEWVESQVGEGDLIRVEPSWRETPLVWLGAKGQTKVDVRRTLQDDDLVAIQRFFIIHEAGRKADGIAVVTGATGEPAKVDTSKAFGTVGVQVLTLPSPKFSTRLSDHIDKAEVSRDVRGQTERCSRWNAQQRRWDCRRSGQWLYVATETHEVGDEPRQCVYAHPLGKGQILNVTFPAVDLGTRLRLRAGLSLSAARKAKGAPVQFAAKINGKPVATIESAFNDQEWHAVEVATQPGKATLSFDITSDTTHRQQFCFDGFVFSDGSAQ